MSTKEADKITMRYVNLGRVSSVKEISEMIHDFVHALCDDEPRRAEKMIADFSIHVSKMVDAMLKRGMTNDEIPGPGSKDILHIMSLLLSLQIAGEIEKGRDRVFSQ